MNKQNLVLCALVLGAAAGCAAASVGESNSGASAKDASGAYSGGSGGTGGAYDPGIAFKLDAAAVGAPDLPPENKQKLDFLAPRAGGQYVYVANPTRNTVDVIDSTKLTITEQTPGDSPTYVATVPGQDVALVINVGSHTLRILRGLGMNAGPIPIISKANSIAISPKGHHAVIWFDASANNGTTTTTTSTSATTGSTQEVSVVDIDTEQVFAMSVGYNPSAVVFSSDDAAAFVVTDDGISKLIFSQITTDGIAPFTRIDRGITGPANLDGGAALGPDTQTAPPDLAPAAVPDTAPANAGDSSPDADFAPIDGGVSPIDGDLSVLDGGSQSPDTTTLPPDLAPPAPEDTAPPATPDTAPPKATPAIKGKPVNVSVTADGAYAIARREGSAEVMLVDLKSNIVTSIELSSPVTDLGLLDLPPVGSAAFAVLRDESTLVRIEIPSGFTDPAHRQPWRFEGVTIGSLTMSPGGRYAVLYTTAYVNSTLLIKDLTVDDDAIIVDLHMAIGAVAVAPDEQTALVLHAPSPASGTGGASGAGGSSGAADTTYGYTLVRLVDGFSKLQQTAALPQPFTITPDSSHAFVLLRDDKSSVRIAERINLTSFIADDFALGSPPTSIAALSASIHKVFVGQEHQEGRISFVDWKTGDVESVTGFALNGRIQQ
jgi:hypothetical protein